MTLNKRGCYTGIVENPNDTIQPFRVWREGKIAWFARTKKEADAVLKKQKLLGKQK